MDSSLGGQIAGYILIYEETNILHMCGCNFHSINPVNLCFKSTVEHLPSKLHLPSVCACTNMHTT